MLVSAIHENDVAVVIVRCEGSVWNQDLNRVVVYSYLYGLFRLTFPKEHDNGYERIRYQM